MAAKSGWQQFAQNFNSVYGATTGFMRDLDEQRTMSAEADPNQTPEQQRSTRLANLADTKLKWGDTEGAMKLRTGLQQQKAADQKYKFNEQNNPQVLEANKNKNDLTKKELGAYDARNAAYLENQRAGTAASLASSNASNARSQLTGLETKAMQKQQKEEDVYNQATVNTANIQDPLKRAVARDEYLRKNLPENANYFKYTAQGSKEDVANIQLQSELLSARVNQVTAAEGPMAGIEVLNQVAGPNVHIAGEKQPDGSIKVTTRTGEGPEQTLLIAKNESDLWNKMDALAGTADGRTRLAATLTAEDKLARAQLDKSRKRKGDVIKELVKGYAGGNISTQDLAPAAGNVLKVLETLDTPQQTQAVNLMETYTAYMKSGDPEKIAKAQAIATTPMGKKFIPAQAGGLPAAPKPQEVDTGGADTGGADTGGLTGAERQKLYAEQTAMGRKYGSAKALMWNTDSADANIQKAAQGDPQAADTVRKMTYQLSPAQFRAAREAGIYNESAQ